MRPADSAESRADDLQTLRRLFDGDRLRLARDLRRRSQSEVGSDVGVSAASISQYEKGESRPSEEALEALARSLTVPPRFFAQQPSDADLGRHAFFRRLRSTSAADRKRARALTLIVRLLTLAIERHVRLPDLAVPRIPLPDGADHADIEETADEVRRQWKVDDGPVPDAVLLLERHGIVATRFDVGSHAMDAFSVPYDDRPVVVLSADKSDRGRSRFDATHELGHLVMHNADDRADKTVEQQAHRFAAAFLMPAADIAHELPSSFDVQHLIALKGHWNVSIAALLRRSRDLDVMHQQAYVNAMKALSVRGWRRKEPGDLGAPESPMLLERAVSFLESRGTSLRQLADQAGVPLDDVRYVLGSSQDPRPELPF